MKCSMISFGDLLAEPIRNGLTKPKAIRGKGAKMIAMGEIFSNSRIGSFNMDRVPITAKEFANCNIHVGDLLFARQSLVLEGAGKCSIVTTVDEPTVFESHLIRARVDISKANPYFLHYYFNSYQGKENIKTIVEQVAAAGIRGSDLIKLSVPCPTIEKQNSIARILTEFDEKIELNQKINDSLIALLQCLYQYQFGNAFESLLVGQLAEICDYSRDKVAVSTLTPSTYYSTENMLAERAGAVDASSLPTVSRTTKCVVGDVLISNIRPYFKKIVYCQSECGCSTDVLCFHPKTPDLSAYLFCTLYADRFFDFMIAGSKGTKMPRGDKQQIMTYPVYVPSDEELVGFNDIARPVLKQVQLNREENKWLIVLRDTLLPKLMSGEIDVSGTQL